MVFYSGSERERLRTIMDEMPIGVALVDATGKVLEINKANNEIWAGRLPRAQDVAGYAVYRGWHRDTGEPMRAEDWPAPRAIAEGRPVTEIVDVERLDGVRVTLRIAASPVHDAQGRVTWVVVVTEDVTEQVERRRLDETLNSIDRLIHSTLEFDEVMERGMREALSALNAEAACVVKYPRGDEPFVRYESGPASAVCSDLCDGGSLTVGELRANKTPIVRDHADGETYVAIPLVVRDDLSGSLGLSFPRTHRLTESEIDFGRRLGISVSTALENAEVYEERQRTLAYLEEKDRSIRQAYSDVIDAVTGGRLIILGKDELDSAVAGESGVAYEIDDPSKLSEARARMRRLIAGTPGENDLLLAFSEGVTNMLKHAGGGTYRVCKDEKRVRVVLSDKGPGIDFRSLPKATLVPGFSTKQTLGMGFTMMMELTDRLLLCSDTSGTTLVLEKDTAPHGQGSVSPSVSAHS